MYLNDEIETEQASSNYNNLRSVVKCAIRTL